MCKIIYHRDIKDQVIILDKERYVAARRLGIDIGFYEITGTDSKKHLINLDTYYLTVLNKINTI